MKLSYRKYDLQLRYPFRIARFSRTETPLVFVELAQNGIVGVGEASMPPYFGESPETAFAFFERVKSVKILSSKAAESIDIQQLTAQFDALEIGNTAAKAALDIALHDLKGKTERRAVWQMLNSDLAKMPPTSLTIGIETDPSVLQQKIKDAEAFSILKIKLGSADDYDLMRQIRNLTDKPLYVDANQGWRDVNFAIEMSHFLKENGVVLIEQPLPKADLDGNARVTEGSPLPVFADESFQRLADFEKINGVFDGVNIKLMKSTGLFEAQLMVAEARRRDMKIMLGCMSETSCAILAAAALAPQCDFVDLDGPWLVSNNPFSPPILKGGKIQLSNSFGLGLRSIKN